MKYDISALIRAIDSAKGCILEKQQSICFNGKEYKSWPLFFSDRLSNSDDVDVCTIGIGIMALSNFNYKNDRAISDTLMQSVNTVLSIRNSDGSWPSKVSLVTKDTFSMEGVISDTFYALSALICVGFLSNNSIASGFTNFNDGSVYDTIEKRILFIEKSVEWLLENRVENCQGWQYTGVRYLENKSDKQSLPAYTMPTANAILILYKIKVAISSINPNHPVVDKIDAAINSSINWLFTVQSNTKSDCGFGIKRGGSSRLSNTARVLLAIGEVKINDTSVQAKIKSLQKRAIKWLIDNYKPFKISFTDVSEDFTQMFIEFDSGTNTIKNVFRRSIIHETYIEPLIIETLYNYYNANKDSIKSIPKRKIFSAIDKALSFMLQSQCVCGEMNGSVACRRQSNLEKYAMYSTTDFICILSKLINESALVKKCSHSNFLFKLRLCVGIVIILLAIGLPMLIGTDKYIYTIPGSLALGLITNVISEKIL